MKLTSALRDHYNSLFSQAKIAPAHYHQVEQFVAEVKPNVARYENAAALLAARGHNIPTWILMVTQAMEGAGRMDRCFHNGQLLSRVTTIVPKGRGPFTGPHAWEDSVLDALLVCEAPLLRLVPDWSLASCLYFEECYNGVGYFNRNMNTPYLWSWTQFYSRGKYVSDGHFDANAISGQPGVVAILKGLIAAGIVRDPLGQPILPKLVTLSEPAQAKFLDMPEIPNALLPNLPAISNSEHASILFSLADKPTKRFPENLGLFTA